MGSKTKTYRGFSASRMFEDEDNLYIQEILRIYAQTGSLKPMDIMPVVLDDANRFFNEIVFEKMGKTIDMDFKAGIITDAAILNVVKKYDSSAYIINDFFIEDANGTPVDSSLLKTKDYLDKKYPREYRCSTQGYQALSEGMFYVTYDTYNIDGQLCLLRISNGKPVMGSDDQGYSGYVMDLLDMETEDEPCDTKGHIIAPVPINYEDDRSVIAVVYNNTKHMFIFDEEVVRSTYTYKGFMLVMRKDFNNVDPKGSRESKFMFARFGLNAPDEDGNTLVDQLDQEDLKDAFLTYASYKENEVFGKYVRQLYAGETTSDNLMKPSNVVEITGELNFKYEDVSIVDMDGFKEQKYIIRYSGGSFDADAQDPDTGEWENRYIIPFEIMDLKKLHEKFDIYNQTFTMFAYSEKTVKVKWYQTVFFRFIMMVIALVFVGPVSILMDLASRLLSIIDPRLAAIIGVVVGLLTGQFQFNLQGVLNFTNNILGVIQTFNTIAFKDSVEAIQAEIKNLKEETEEDRESIEDTLHDAIYIPFDDKVRMQYNDLYDLATRTPELVYNSVDPETYTNYDKYYNLY